MLIFNSRWFFTYGLALTLVLIFVSYYWIDIPLVDWAVRHQLRHYVWLQQLQQLPEFFPQVAFIGIILVGVHACWSRSSKLERAVFYTSLSYVLSNFLTKVAKIIFARTWPATWVNNNPSWIRDHVYGFFWFVDDPGYRSFPSGHTSAMLAVAFAIGYFYPRTRWIAALLCGMVIVGLISQYHHFLSDIIAGAYLGIACAIFALEWQESV